MKRLINLPSTSHQLFILIPTRLDRLQGVNRLCDKLVRIGSQSCRKVLLLLDAIPYRPPAKPVPCYRQLIVRMIDGPSRSGFLYPCPACQAHTPNHLWLEQAFIGAKKRTNWLPSFHCSLPIALTLNSRAAGWLDTNFYSCTHKACWHLSIKKSCFKFQQSTYTVMFEFISPLQELYVYLDIQLCTNQPGTYLLALNLLYRLRLATLAALV